MTQQRLFKRTDRGRYKPKLKHSDQVRAGQCQWKTQKCLFEDKGGEEQHFRRVPTGELKDCRHKAFYYRVNHTILPLCRCHAARLAKKKGVRVVAIRESA